MDLITSTASPPHGSQQSDNPDCFNDADHLSNEEPDFIIEEGDKSLEDGKGCDSNNGPFKEHRQPLLETTSVFKDFITDVRKKLVEKIKTVKETDHTTDNVKSGRFRAGARRQVARKSTNLVQSSILLCFSSKPKAVKHKLNGEKNMDNVDGINASDEIEKRIDENVTSDIESERPSKMSRIETKPIDIHIQVLDDVSRSSAPEIGRKRNDVDAPTRSSISRSKSLLDVPASSSTLISEADKLRDTTKGNLENSSEMDGVSKDDEQILIKIVETAKRVAEKSDDKMIHESEKLSKNSCINDEQDNSIIRSNKSPLKKEKSSKEDQINPVIVKKEPIELDDNSDSELLSDNDTNYSKSKINEHKESSLNTSTEEVPISDSQKVDSTFPSNSNLSLADTHQESDSRSPSYDQMDIGADDETEEEAQRRIIDETLENNSIKVITTDTDYQGSTSAIIELSFDDRKKNDTKKNGGSIGEKESKNDSKDKSSISKDPVSVASFDDDDLVLIFHSGVSSSKDKSDKEECHLDFKKEKEQSKDKLDDNSNSYQLLETSTSSIKQEPSSQND